VTAPRALGAGDLTPVDLAVPAEADVSDGSPVVTPLRPLVAVEESSDRVEVVRSPRSRRLVARLARLLVVCADGLTVMGAMATSYALLPALTLDAGGQGASAYRRLAVVALPLWVVVFRRYRLYNARHVAGRRDEVTRVVHAVGVSVLVTALVAYFLDLVVDRSWFVLTFVVAGAAVVVERELVRYGFSVLRRKGYCLRPVAIAGTGAEALALVRMFEQSPELGYCVVGLIGRARSRRRRLQRRRPRPRR
jgi:hypothetical protein